MGRKYLPNILKAIEIILIVVGFLVFAYAIADTKKSHETLYQALVPPKHYYIWPLCFLTGLAFHFIRKRIPGWAFIGGCIFAGILLITGYIENFVLSESERLIPSISNLWFPLGSLVIGITGLIASYQIAMRTRNLIAGMDESTKKQSKRIESALEPITGMPGYLECAASMYKSAEECTVTVLKSWHWDERFSKAFEGSRADYHYFIGPMIGTPEPIDHNLGGLLCRFELAQQLRRRDHRHFVFYHADADKLPARFVATDQEVVTTGTSPGCDETIRGFVRSREPSIKNFYLSFHKIVLSQPELFGVRPFQECIIQILQQALSYLDNPPSIHFSLLFKTIYESYRNKCEAYNNNPSFARQDIPVGNELFENALYELMSYLNERGNINITGRKDHGEGLLIFPKWIQASV
jgi:hypothetical protein